MAFLRAEVPYAPNPDGSLGSRPPIHYVLPSIESVCATKYLSPSFIDMAIAHLQIFDSAQWFHPESFILINPWKSFIDYLRFHLLVIEFLSN
jgi:hypothetical protein